MCVHFSGTPCRFAPHCHFSWFDCFQAVASSLSVPCEITELVMVYWKLKRKANFNRPLITPKNEEDTALAEAAETNLQRRLRMFTHLRLENVQLIFDRV